MVATDEVHTLGMLDLEGQEQADDLQGVQSPHDEVHILGVLNLQGQGQADDLQGVQSPHDCHG